MNRIKFTYTTICLLAILLICVGFADDNPFFKISNKDVELKQPKNFPKPFYNFKNNKLSADIFVLGRKLFYDNILSKDYSVNCGTCHQQFAAFAHIDHRLSHGIYAKIGTRNVPALQNLIWKDTYMWDGGVNNLEVQPIHPITSPIEMDETLANVVSKLKKSTVYQELFKKAFHDTTINSERMLKALAQFTGLMISAQAKYDLVMANKDTFSMTEKNGLLLFRARCATCHKEPLFTDNSYRNNGIKADSLLNDIGRAAVSGNTAETNHFKVPGLRNVVLTYPYMHDGRYKNLKEVLDHYANSKTHDVLADTAIKRIAELSKQQKNDLITFLNTLTDQTFLHDRRFVDPAMAQK